MTRDEFVALHGEDLWLAMVAPRQGLSNQVIAGNANVIVHTDMLMPVVHWLDETATGMLDIRRRYTKASAPASEPPKSSYFMETTETVRHTPGIFGD